MTLEEKVAKLEEENFLLGKANDELKGLLQQPLNKLNKNSSNSSKASSTDIVLTKSLRASTGQKRPVGKKAIGVLLFK